MTTIRERYSCALNIGGMDCPSCGVKIEKAIEKLDGVQDAEINFTTGRAIIYYDCDKTTLEDILKTIKQLGYEPTPIKSGTEASLRARRRIYAINLSRIAGVSILILLALYQIPPIPLVTLGFAWVAAIGGGYPIFRHAFNEIRSRSIGTQTFITISIIAALALAEAFSAAVVALFVLVAEFLELFTVDQSRKAIGELVESAPTTALVIRDNVEVMLPIEEVKEDQTQNSTSE